MDYYNYRCPVCEKPFDKDSEIVVCPVCGTPHHRECYDINNRCFYEDKHAEGFDFRAENPQGASSENTENNTQNRTNNRANQQNRRSDIISCKNCGTFNVASNKTCSNCGEPLEQEADGYNSYDRHTQEQNTPPYQNANRNPQQPFAGFTFDPLGGLKADEDLGNGVTAQEVSKFTKNNSPFFCRLFRQIKTYDKSRLSFVGFLFHGGWLLYRKMYKIGIFITALIAMMIISQLYIETFYEDLMKNFANATNNVSYSELIGALSSFFEGLDTENRIVMGIYAFSSIGQFAIRIICALCGNRWYYKHCIKTISKIKSNSGTESTESVLETKGGVNGTLALSLVITYALLSFLPTFF